MKKLTVSVVLAALALGCASNRDAIEASQRFPKRINWPQEYEPEEASFFIHNEIEIAAPPERVWNILIRAESWPDWYEGARNVKLLGGKRVLDDGAVFTWTTMGLDFTSTIREFVPHERLSWESEKDVISGYHAWLIIPTDTGCTLITDEAQNGFLTFFEKIFEPNTLRELHDVWLEQIKRKAERAG